MNTFLRIHAVQELYRRDRYSGFLKCFIKMTWNRANICFTAFF